MNTSNKLNHCQLRSKVDVGNISILNLNTIIQYTFKLFNIISINFTINLFMTLILIQFRIALL